MKELHKGKVKTVFQSEKPDEVLIRFEDKVTCGNGKHQSYPQGKGAINCEISALLFEKLHRTGIRTHYIDRPASNIMRCKKVEALAAKVHAIDIQNYIAELAGEIFKAAWQIKATLRNS